MSTKNILVACAVRNITIYFRNWCNFACKCQKITQTLSFQISTEFSFVFDMKFILVWLFQTVVSLGGAACHGCHHFEMTPFVFFCIETENPLIGRQKLFFWFSPIVWLIKGATMKSRLGCHHSKRRFCFLIIFYVAQAGIVLKPKMSLMFL